MEHLLGEKVEKVIGVCVDFGPRSAPILPLFAAHRFVKHIKGYNTGRTQCIASTSIDILQPQTNRKLSIHNSSGLSEEVLREFVRKVDTRFSVDSPRADDVRLLPYFQDSLNATKTGPTAIFLSQSEPWGYTAFGALDSQLYPVVVYNEDCTYLVVSNVENYPTLVKSLYPRQFFFHRMPTLHNSCGIIFTYRIASRLGRWRTQGLSQPIVLAALEDLLTKSMYSEN